MVQTAERRVCLHAPRRRDRLPALGLAAVGVGVVGRCSRRVELESQAKMKKLDPFVPYDLMGLVRFYVEGV